MGEVSTCSICGEPMPEGEEMFKMHGYSGDCPKPPLPRPQALDPKKMEEALRLIVEMDGEQPVRSVWNMLHLARAALGIRHD